MKYVKLKFSSNTETIGKKNLESERQRVIEQNKNVTDIDIVDFAEKQVASGFTGEINIILSLMNLAQKKIDGLSDFSLLLGFYNKMQKIKDAPVSEVLIPESEFNFLEKGIAVYFSEIKAGKIDPNPAWLWYQNLINQLYAPEYVIDSLPVKS